MTQPESCYPCRQDTSRCYVCPEYISLTTFQLKQQVRLLAYASERQLCQKAAPGQATACAIPASAHHASGRGAAAGSDISTSAGCGSAAGLGAAGVALPLRAPAAERATRVPSSMLCGTTAQVLSHVLCTGQHCDEQLHVLAGIVTALHTAAGSRCRNSVTGSGVGSTSSR